MIRPKLASSPKIADFTRFELTIVLPIFLASDIDLAPETLTLINFVAPSPSLAIALAKNVQTKLKASTNVSHCGWS